MCIYQKKITRSSRASDSPSPAPSRSKPNTPEKTAQNKARNEAATDLSAPKPKSSRTRSRGGRNRRRRQNTPEVPWHISQFPVPEVEGKTRCHDLGLETDLLHAIADLKCEYCSPIQAQSLPLALQGRDVVGKAQTGTGKTAAFLTAIIGDFLKNAITAHRYAGRSER